MRTRGQDPTLPEMRRVRLLEMADAMDMFCQGLVCAFHSSPQELIGSNSWSGESVSEVPPASIQVEVARLHAPRRNAGGRQGIGRRLIHANPFHVLAEAA